MALVRHKEQNRIEHGWATKTRGMLSWKLRFTRVAATKRYSFRVRGILQAAPQRARFGATNKRTETFAAARG